MKFPSCKENKNIDTVSLVEVFQIAAKRVRPVRVCRSPPPILVCVRSRNGASTGPTGSRSRATTSAPRGARPPPPSRTWLHPTGSRSLAPTAAPRGARRSLPPRTYPRPTDSRSRATTAAPRDTRPQTPPSTSPRPMGSRSRAPTAELRGARRTPRTRTCMCPTGSLSRVTPSTLRAFRATPMSHKGVLDATGALPVAGAAARLNIRGAWHALHQAPQTEAPSPPPRRASHDSPLGVVRDRRGRRNSQT